jgi:hypothetical protein
VEGRVRTNTYNRPESLSSYEVHLTFLPQNSYSFLLAAIHLSMN